MSRHLADADRHIDTLWDALPGEIATEADKGLYAIHAALAALHAHVAAAAAGSAAGGPPPASAAPGWVLTGTHANEERYINLGVGRWTGANYWRPTVANPRALLHLHSPEGVTVLHDDDAAPARAKIRALAGLPA